MPTLSNNRDPYSVYNFWVEWDNIVHAGFQECSGLSLTRNAGTYREGTDSSLGMRQIPGLNSKGNITLKRGMTDNDEMWKWHNAIFKGATERRNLSDIIRQHFDARPAKLIAELQLLRPVFSPTAAYGHFGRPEFTWEKTPKLEALKAEL